MFFVIKYFVIVRGGGRGGGVYISRPLSCGVLFHNKVKIIATKT